MRPEPTSTVVRARLAELAAARKATFAGLSRALQRPERYLDRFVRDGHPERLTQAEAVKLAAFFDVGPWELGGYIAPRRR